MTNTVKPPEGTMTDLTPTFRNKFRFRKDLAYQVGVEREFFITDLNGNIVPEAPKVLGSIRNPLIKVGSFGYELSACQIETQSLPGVDWREIYDMQMKLMHELEVTLAMHGLTYQTMEVAPESMPRDVYPDTRYLDIAKQLTTSVSYAAMAVAGTHFHVGMPNHDTALRVYNRVIEHNEELCTMGDGSNGRRLELYKQMAPNHEPVPYTSWEDFEHYARAHGFADDPRNCWHFIRLTRHGTIEFRNFGVTDSLDDLIKWAGYCRELCLRG